MTKNDLNLDARGFGWLIDPAPAHDKIQVAAPGSQFSYFTYAIVIQAPTVWDKTWANLPVDGIWSFMKASGFTSASPCLLHLCDNADGLPAVASPELARHWCPIFFENYADSCH